MLRSNAERTSLKKVSYLIKNELYETTFKNIHMKTAYNIDNSIIAYRTIDTIFVRMFILIY